MKLLKRLFVWTGVALVVAELLLVLVSWLLSATQTGNVHSLLSSEGVRWLMGQFAAMLATPWLSWLLLLSMAGGCLGQSGLFTCIISPFTSLTYRQRIALRMTIVFLVLYIFVIILLTAIPHAVLLSATGRLFPSPFSRALVPILAFGLLLLSAIYGWASGRFTSIANVFDSLSSGIAGAAPLFILYVLIVQFVQSLHFVFF